MEDNQQPVAPDTMYGLEVTPVSKVSVKTKKAKPFLPLSERKPILSERILLRPFQASDLDAYHRLRCQPDVMKWTGQGRPDANIDETKKSMSLLVPPEGDAGDIYAITLRETGEFLGSVGIRYLDGALGWPELGYMILKEHWGKGYATEFLRAYLEHWWALPREETETELKVDTRTISGEAPGSLVNERLTAITGGENEGSKNVLVKLGFTLVAAYREEEEEAHLGQVGTGFVLAKP